MDVAHRKIIAIWTGTFALSSVAVIEVLSPAFAAPAIDTIVPTANYGYKCAQGLSSATVCKTDNRTVTYYMDSNGAYELESPDRTAAKKAVARYREHTDLSNISYDSTPSFSGDAETDVIFQEGAFGYPDSFKGITWCNDPVADYKCDQQYIRIRGAGNYDEDTAAHEFGHAIGATHGRDSSPAQDQCASKMGVMRAYEDCREGNPAIGNLVKANINYIY